MYLKALVLCAVLLVSVTSSPVAKPYFDMLEESCIRQGGMCVPEADCDAGSIPQLPNLCPKGQNLGIKCCYL